jgi:hypothetical protein
MTTKTSWDTVVHPHNHPVPIEDPMQLLPRSCAKLYNIWMSLTYPFASKGDSLSTLKTDTQRPALVKTRTRSAVSEMSVP